MRLLEKIIYYFPNFLFILHNFFPSAASQHLAANSLNIKMQKYFKMVSRGCSLSAGDRRAAARELASEWIAGCVRGWLEWRQKKR